MITGRTVELRGRVFRLNEEMRVVAGRTLSIRGPGMIVGDGHTLFRTNGNRQHLKLEGVRLVHCGSSTRLERRELGGAIFALGKSRVTLTNCNVTSHQGFGIWMVQRAKVDVDSSALLDCGRSGVVSFGQARLRLTNSTISGSRLHGVCARGSSAVSIERSAIVDSGVRGIYVYHNASLQLHGSSISGTRDPAAAAVQVEALRPEDQCRLCIDSDCQLHGNEGANLLVRGNVRRFTMGSST